jgi:alpha-galactosidase
MPGLAGEIRRIGARPGIWIRRCRRWPTRRIRGACRVTVPFLDPSIPDVLQKVAADVTRLRQWGFELVKHDYTTFDIFGRWGFQMGPGMTRDGWTFAAGTGTHHRGSIDGLYRTIRTAAAETLVIGCNTISHLSAGHFDICRVGDDTSGTDWARTRKMGVNTLAFRGPQHGAFYVADADCVGVTKAVPWSFNKQWLDLLARSGTMLFVSLAPDALGADERVISKPRWRWPPCRTHCASLSTGSRSIYPTRWRLMGRETAYDWVGADGAG